MPSSTSKYQLYQNVLKKEFIHEFRALVEAANGRGEFKADFTDKIFSLFGKVIQPVTDSVPAAPVILSVAELISHKANESRKEAKSNYFLHKGFEYNANELTVLAEQMSLAALKRYQWFVSQLDEDSIIPFAKAGVERMLEYLARTQLPLTFQHLLDGFIQGHSGAYMSGYFNTQLTPIDCLVKRISASKVKKAFGFTRVTAEGIYGRSGLMSCDAHSSELHVHTQPDKAKAKHKNQQEQSRFDKIKDGLSRKGREHWFDYGYTKTHSEYTEEPKYGYALVSPDEVLHYYGDEKSITSKPLAALESPLKNSLTNFSYEIIPFNKSHLNDYLNARKEIANLTLLAYLKDKFHSQSARFAYFDDKDKDLSNFDLAGAHLDHCVFDDCIFSANLTDTILCNSFLRHADFTRVEHAKGLDLSETHAEYLEAVGANLSHAILHSTNFLGANLAKANLTGADILGANLIESNLKGTISFTANLQTIQSEQEKLAAQQQPAPEEKKPELPALLPVFHFEHIKQELAARYQKQAVMLEFVPHQSKQITVPISEETFIHLALATQGQQQQKEQELRKELKQNYSYGEEKEAPEKALEIITDNKNEDHQRQQLLSSWELLNQVQEHININDLWLSQKNDPHVPQHLIIEGSAGTGKTTLCGYIATQWSQQKLWSEQFNWVLWIPLRNLIDTRRYPQRHHFQYSVKSLVMGECFGCLPNEQKPALTLGEQEGVWQQLEEQADRVLYILDGYDKIAGFETHPELFYLQTAIVQLLKSKHILLTTHPQVINAQLFKEQNTRRLVTMGLSDENIPAYVEHYFKAISNHYEEKHYDSTPLLEGLKANQTLWSVSHIPLHLSLICLAYAEGRAQVYDLKQGFSLTQLYQQIVSVLLLRYAKEKSKETQSIAARLTAATVESESNTKKLTQFLEEFAFRGMRQYDFILNDKLLNESLEATNQELEIVPDLIASGLLKEINDRGKMAYQFMHLTFQEFFAARYLARKFQQDERSVSAWIEYFNEYKHIPRFAMIMCFTAGLLKDKSLHLQQFFQLLQAEPRDEIGLYHLGLVMRCIAEAGYPEKLTQQVSQYVGKSVEKCWVAIREVVASKDGFKERKARSAQVVSLSAQVVLQLVQTVLQWLGQQRLLTPKIEFPALSLNTIIKDLSDGNSRIRQAAARALGELKASTPEILQALVALLKYKKWEAREGAARALGELNTPTPEILQGLVALLKDNESDVRQAAARALGELKTPTPEILLSLTALLKDNDRHVRQAAARALAELKAPTPEILQDLVALLKDNDRYVREAAARTLGELKASTPEILLSLVALLKDEKWPAREGGARALGELKVPTPEILEGLVALLKDNDNSVRLAAVGALGELKPTLETLQGLVTSLKDNYTNVRKAAAEALSRALGELKAPTPEILLALIALLKDNDPDVRLAVARALGEFKAPTPEILQGLVALLKDNDRYVRQAAALALGELNTPTPEILQGLVALLKDNESDVKQAAAQALGELKTPTPEILQGLVALLKGFSLFGKPKQAAARALGELKAPTPEILLALVALLKYDEEGVRQAAARALGELKAPTPEILQGLVALLNDKYSDVRQAATEALNKFSTADLFNIYFQQNGQLQQTLLTIIIQRWLLNRQVVKFASQAIYWLEQGEWQHLSIPESDPDFQSYFTENIQKVVCSPLSFTFSKPSAANDVAFFSMRPSSSQSAMIAEPKEKSRAQYDEWRHRF